MNETEALAKMISPGMPRRRKPLGGVLQIWVTRACDKSCFNCTQGSNLSGNPGMITLEQFEQACISLKDYFGVVGVFGGNPALHPEFETLCDILSKHIPSPRRGLWCNHPKGHGQKMRETFNPSVSNLNVHLDETAYQEFKRDWPESRPFGLDKDSRHSPVYVAMKDVIEDESERWKLISSCDINHHWSAMIGVFRGELRGYFCEIAGAQAMLHQNEPDYPDLGVAVEPGWWKRHMQDPEFSSQVRFHCHRCGVPLRGHGELAQSDQGISQTSLAHMLVYLPKKNDRNVQVATDREQLKEHPSKLFTDYMGGASQ